MRIVSGTALAAGSRRHRRIAPCRSLIATQRFRLDNALGSKHGHVSAGDQHVVMPADVAGVVHVVGISDSSGLTISLACWRKTVARSLVSTA